LLVSRQRSMFFQIMVDGLSGGVGLLKLPRRLDEIPASRVSVSRPRCPRAEKVGLTGRLAEMRFPNWKRRRPVGALPDQRRSG
jgi:hypothetical protein